MTRHQRNRRLSIPSLLLFVFGVVAVGLLLYPTAANWFSTIGHNNATTEYIRNTIDEQQSGRAQRLLEDADRYNASLPHGTVRDPYSTSSTAPGLDAAAYRGQLADDHGAVVARLRYPRLNIDLPVYRGTSAEVLRRGVGHLFGSSLPVGGSGTHAVLSAHSGAPYAGLFDPVHDARVGDRIEIDVLGRHLVYGVTSIETVEPDDTESLRIEDDRDRLTLLTCTPIGINTHRLLVHAERVDPGDLPRGSSTAVVPAPPTGFLWADAWWMPVLLAAMGVLWYLIRPLRRSCRLEPAPFVSEQGDAHERRPDHH